MSARNGESLPSFSVILPTYNRCEVVRQTLRQLAAQDYPAELLSVYVVDYGSLHRITFQAGSGGQAPATLSATGCANPSDAKQASSGLIPYGVSAQFWSDGAVKDRWIGLPNGSSIVVQSDGDWDFPTGTVLRKDFRLANQLVETRLLMRHPDGNWGGFTYAWNSQQTDATLLNWLQSL